MLLFILHTAFTCLSGLLQTGTKEPLMAWGVPRKQRCHLRRHCSRNSPRVFLLSFPPAPDQRPQGKWILGGGGVSGCELVCFTAISQRLCSSSENRSSIINFSCITRKEQGSGVKGTERGLAREAKESIEGKVALSTPCDVIATFTILDLFLKNCAYQRQMTVLGKLRDCIGEQFKRFLKSAGGKTDIIYFRWKV